MTNHNEIEFERPKVGLRLLLAAGASVLAMGFSATAIAQDADENADDDDNIVVTGSRISRPGVDTIRPAITVDTEEFDKRAFTNIADALNEIPAFGNGLTPNGAQNSFTVGQNFVDLFNLGTQRTLTLVDGRRFVSSNVPTTFGSAGGLQVDLNSIPVAMIKRIDVVPLAGAAVYGSDAIAGTLNVILRDDYEGAEFGGQYGVTEFGDFQTYQAQAVFGASTADGRGNTTFSVEYNEQEGGLLNKRPFFFADDPNTVDFGRLDRDNDGNFDDVDGDGDPDTFRRVFLNQRVQLFGPGGSVSPSTFIIPSFGIGTLADGNFYQFDPQGNLQTCVPGQTPGVSSAFFAQGGTCGVDFFDSVAQIRSPLERLVISSNSHYDIRPNVRAIVQTTFANSKASELVNQGGFQTWPFGGTSSGLTFGVDNPFLTSQARGILQSNGLTTFGLNRFNNDIVNSGENSTENFTYRVVTALEGDFNSGGRKFNWDLSAVFGESDVETRAFGIVDGRFINAIDAVRVDNTLLQTIITNNTAVNTLAEALVSLNDDGLSGVSNIRVGDIICNVNAQVAAGTLTGANLPPAGNGVTDGDLPYATGCVPLNLFGEGVASAEAIAFINGGPRITSSDIGQRVFTANFGGEAFRLPAGWAQFNVGFENRREGAEFTPGLGTAIPITRSSAFVPTGGTAETTEFYGEILLPITEPGMNIPGFHLFELTASGRKVNNQIKNLGSETGSSATNDVYEFGGRWSPVEDIIFRASYTSAIRAPALVELFTPTVQAFLFASDPCDVRFIDGGAAPAVRAANCAADGIPVGFISDIVNRSIIGATQGNPDLRSERSKSYNIGAIIQPRWVDNLTVQVDYFNIKIEDRITPLSLTQIMNACYDSPTFRVDNEFCSSDLFRRIPATGSPDDNQVNFGLVGEQNAGLSAFAAVQFQVAYNFDIADAFSNAKILKSQDWAKQDLGELAFRVQVLRAIKNNVQTGSALPTSPIGSFGDPQWEATWDTTYTNGPWRAFWRIAYTDAPVFNTLGNSYLLDANDNIVNFGSRTIHNASFAYTHNEMTSIQVGIDNVMNRKPDFFQQAAGYFGTTEMLGRRYTFRVRSRF
ncbi:MAG: TonB-dependent receptor [Robiginitomaculum sp.]|nr:TonB-dependent receptor [Robiginitomaculum sp.]